MMLKCLILAAGYATRLYPLTEHFPKPLLTVQGKPILDWLIADLDETNLISEYAVVTNHAFAQHFDSWAKEKPQAITVYDDGTASNETRLGAVCDMQFVFDRDPDQTDYLVIAGDNLLDFSLSSFLSYAQATQTSCVMRYAEASTEKLKKCGVLSIDSNDRIMQMVEKSPNPPSNWCCPPFYYLTAKDVRRISSAIADGCSTDAPGSFIAWLSRVTAVHAMQMPGSRYDIGNLDSYRQVQEQYHGITRA